MIPYVLLLFVFIKPHDSVGHESMREISESISNLVNLVVEKKAAKFNIEYAISIQKILDSIVNLIFLRLYLHLHLHNDALDTHTQRRNQYRKNI